MKYLKFGIGIIFFGFLVSSICLARGDEIKPAKFYEDGKDFLSKIDFPEKSFEGTVVVRGAADISKGGLSTALVFYTDTKNRDIFKPYEDAIRKAFGPRIKVLPATVNGKRKRVWINFSVVFEKNQEQNSINIYQNLLYNTNSYGNNYIDPQRFVLGRFPDACRKNRYGEGSMVWLAANIDENGIPSNSRIVTGEASGGCKRKLIELLSKSSFIPAQYEGKFVSATYVEVWFTY